MNNDILQKHLDTIIESSSKVRKFIDGVVDAGSFVETDVFMSGATFLDGVEAKGEGVVTGYATLNGSPVQLFAQNTEVLKGSLSVAQAQKIVKTINKAIKTGTPLLSLIDSCGARIGEGVSVLEGYGAVLAAAVELANQVTHICVINGVCVGMMATFAAMADFVFMNKESVLSLNSPMVIASTQKDYPKFNDILGYKSYSANSNMAQFEFKDAKDLKAKITDLFSIINVSEEESSDDPNREA
ncbi:MAG: carboxyl transferase domain-containing protein, partial [Clostridia bacterium]